MEIIKFWWPYIQNPIINAIQPENRSNIDETGIIEGRKPNTLVLGLNGLRQLQRKEPGTRGWTSIIECMSGVALPSLVTIFAKEKNSAGSIAEAIALLVFCLTLYKYLHLGIFLV